MLRAFGRSGLLRQGRQALLAGGQRRGAETQAVGEKLDWDALQDFVTSEGGRRELAALRTTYLDLHGKEQDQKPLKINWDQYKGDVEPATLELFKKAFNSLELPNYDPSNDIKAAKAAFEPLFKQAEELAAFSQKRLKEIDAELKAIQQEKEKISKLTVHEELAANPEIAKQIEKEISEGNYLP